MTFQIRAMTGNDYDRVRALWDASDGVGLDASDEREPIVQYLLRNPDLSLVAYRDESLIGAVLCGHDGRRGYLSHLAVADEHRQQGIGRELVSDCLAKLGRLGILRCNIRLFVDNHHGTQFWRKLGWIHRDDLTVMTQYTS